MGVRVVCQSAEDHIDVPRMGNNQRDHKLARLVGLERTEFELVHMLSL